MALGITPKPPIQEPGGKARDLRRVLIKSGVITPECLAYANLIANPQNCDLTDYQIGQALGGISAQTVSQGLAPLIKIAGSRLWLQIALYLAPIKLHA